MQFALCSTAALAILSALLSTVRVSAAPADTLACGVWLADSILDAVDDIPNSKKPIELPGCSGPEGCRVVCGEKCNQANYQRGSSCAAATYTESAGICTHYSTIKPIANVVPSGGDTQLFITCPEVNGICTNAVTESLEEIEQGICFNVLDDEVESLVAEYDPKSVDWRSYMLSIKRIAETEPRFCNFAIRANFHDSGAIQSSNVGKLGADGSLFLDKYEFLRPENAYDAFAAFVARILRRLAQYFGITLADAIAVAHVTCVEHLGGSVDILAECEANGTPLYAGKLEANFPFDQSSAAARVANLPGNRAAAKDWMSFWLEKMNNAFNDGNNNFKFTIKEALALMGSHTLLDNQACTTTSCPAGLLGSFFGGDRNPPKRMFTWNTDYFKDSMSGSVTVKNNAFGRAPTKGEEQQLEACTFQSQAALAVKQNLECKLKTAAQQLGIPLVPEDDDYRFVTWKPNNDRSPCCGDECEKCSWLDSRWSDNKRWCKGNEVGAAFWFYTINDANLVNAAKAGGSFCPGCGGGINWGAQAQEMYSGYQSFKNDQVAFDKAYARALCKLNHVGAQYSDKSKESGGGTPVKITKALLNQCITPSGSSCPNDPRWEGSKLVVKKPNVCCQSGGPTCGQQKFNYFLNPNQNCNCGNAGQENDDRGGLIGGILGGLLGLLGR